MPIEFLAVLLFIFSNLWSCRCSISDRPVSVFYKNCQLAHEPGGLKTRLFGGLTAWIHRLPKQAAWWIIFTARIRRLPLEPGSTR
jgi:hypothetical protein